MFHQEYGHDPNAESHHKCNGLCNVHQDSPEHCSIRVNQDGIAKHVLGIVLVKLEILRSKSFILVGLFDELSTGEFHDAGDDIHDPPIINNLVGWVSTEVFHQ